MAFQVEQTLYANQRGKRGLTPPTLQHVDVARVSCGYGMYQVRMETEGVVRRFFNYAVNFWLQSEL